MPQDTSRQIDLFTNVERIEKLEKLDLCIETIRQRFGKDSIKNAVLCQNLRLPPERAEITMPTGIVELGELGNGRTQKSICGGKSKTFD